MTMMMTPTIALRMRLSPPPLLLRSYHALASNAALALQVGRHHHHHHHHRHLQHHRVVSSSLSCSEQSRRIRRHTTAAAAAAAAASTSTTTSTITSNAPSSSASASGSVSGTSSRALVLVLGWLGASAPHLDKYIQLYEREGHQVISYRPTPLSFLFPSRYQRDIDRLIHQCHTQLSSSPSRPLIVHAMSNQGTYFWGAMLHRIHNHRPPIKQIVSERQSFHSHVSGLIFDSAPSELHLSILTRGYTGFLARGQYEHPIIIPIANVLFRIILAIPYFKKTIQTLRSALLHHQPQHACQLYLYSEADLLIPADNVRAYIQQQMAAAPTYTSPSLTHESPSTSNSPSTSPSRCITWHEFQGSAHVQHYRTHPAEYRAAVTQFIQHCQQRYHKTENT